MNIFELYFFSLQNGVINGSKWSKMSQDYPKLFKITKNGENVKQKNLNSVERIF